MNQGRTVNLGSSQIEFFEPRQLRQMSQAGSSDLRVIHVQVRQLREPAYVDEPRICQRRFVNLKMLKFCELRQVACALVRNLVAADRELIQLGEFRNVRHR